MAHEPEVRKDIFISYRNDNAGNNFAIRLAEDLRGRHYSVYLNPDEARVGPFPDRLRHAVLGCKDFILILSEGCLSRLMRDDKIDWVREELLTAYAHRDRINIIPILMSGVEMPADKDVMPKTLRFLPDLDAIAMPEQYIRSPFDVLTGAFHSKPERGEIYRDTYNGNESYDVNAELARAAREAEEGSPRAMYELASMYYYGFADADGGSERSYEQAWRWYERVAETENDYTASAEAMLGEMCYRGSAPREGRSLSHALTHYRRAGERSGHANQQAAYMLSRGMGCELSLDEAEKIYLSEIERGDSIAYHDLADLYIRYGKHKEAAALYTRIIDRFPKAEYKLGCLYLTGVLETPPKPNYFMAAFHFQRVIAKGDCGPEVYFQLARLYFAPTGGFPQDLRLAQEYYKRAADMGDLDGQYMVAYMYEYGHIEQNLDLAVHYHTLAAEQGHSHSPTHLAMLYQQPKFKNYHKAYHYAEMAAELGEKEGLFILANLLYFGRGCKADPDRAYRLYERAAHHGVDQARLMLERIKQDRAKA